jgi:hypothetical protein
MKNLKTASGPSVADFDGEKIPWLKLFIPYMSAFLLVFLFKDAIYWDDWTLFNVDEQLILETFKEAGAIFNWTGYFHVAMLKIGPPLYRLLVLVLGYLSGVLLWLLLRTFREVTYEERFWIALLFLVLPFNPARFALINAPGTLCLFSFFLAWYLFIEKPGIFSKSLSLILFLFSFNTPSLLVFYFLPMMHAAWFLSEQKFKWECAIQWVLRNILFFLAPIFYFFFKMHFFKPYGLYAGYNNISFKLMLVGLLPLPVMFLGVYCACKYFKNEWRTNRWFLFGFSGLFILWLAVFPYMVVGKLPTFNDWDSRHQLLMPLGAALSLVGVGWFFGNLRRFCCIVAIVSVFITTYFMLVLSLDWWKQKEIIKFLSYSQEVKAARTIVVVDMSSRHNTFGRTNAFYEYNGWLKKSFGNEIRFAVNYLDIENLTSMRLPEIYRKYTTSRYNAGNYVWSQPDLIVTIRSSVRRFMRGDGFIEVTTEKIATYQDRNITTRHAHK